MRLIFRTPRRGRALSGRTHTRRGVVGLLLDVEVWIARPTGGSILVSGFVGMLMGVLMLEAGPSYKVVKPWCVCKDIAD